MRIGMKIKKYDYFSLMNTKFYRKSVGYQRIELKKEIRKFKNKNGIIKGRFNKKNTTRF